MDSASTNGGAPETPGLSVTAVADRRIASLRYFDSAGSFGSALRNALGRTLPQPLRVIHGEHAGGAHFLIAWRSPTESLLLSSDGAAFRGVLRQLAAEPGGCMVDQTGGIREVRVAGPKARELLLRLGAATAIPGLDEARTGRFAELPVLVVCVKSDEYLLLVERAYEDHFIGWLRVAAADL